MKKLLILAIIFLYVFAACEQPVNDEPNLPKLTVRNEASYKLTDVKFLGIPFAISGSTGLLPSEQVTKELTGEHLNQAGYITFTREDIEITLRTAQAITIDEEECVFTFLDSTPVEEMGNNDNRGTLSAIDFESEIIITYNDSLNISKNDTVDTGEGFLNEIKQLSFAIKNSGKGKLSLIGLEPIKSNSEHFAIIQPKNSSLGANETSNFIVNFKPTEIKNYTAGITIVSNMPEGDFTFIITAKAVPPKAIATVLYDNAEIAQNGTIDIGKVRIQKTGTASITLRNDGNEVLAVDTAGITITGTNTDDFSFVTRPAAKVAVGGQSDFTIQVIPAGVGVNNAVLSIPTSDGLRNPILINLKVTGILDTPLITATAKSTSSIDISWNSINGAASYKIYRSAASDGTFTQIATQSTTLGIVTESYTDTGLAPGTAYYYKVSAVTSNGEEGEPSVIGTAYTLINAPVLNNVETVTIQVIGKLPSHNYGIKLTWVKAPGISSYTVYRSTNPDSDFIAVKSSTSNTLYDDYGLSPELTYYYKLAGRNYNGDEVVSSAVVSCSTNIAQPVLAAKSADSIQIQWNSIAGADSYNIYRRTGAVTNGNSLKIGSASADTTMFTDTGLASGTYYTYHITALIDGVENTSRSAIMVTAPPAPVGFYVDHSHWGMIGGEFIIQLRWSNTQCAAGYKLYRATSASGPYSDITGSVSISSAESQSGCNDRVNTVTTYYYKVKAVNAGGESDFSSVVSATVTDPNE